MHLKVDNWNGNALGQYLGPIVKVGVIKTPVHKTADLAGGCFWGMEEIIRRISGDGGTTVRCTGGPTEDSTREEELECKL